MSTSTVSISKAKKKTKIGLIISTKENGTPFIKSFRPGSISEHSGLKIGEVILSINDVPCEGKTAAQIVDMIKDLKGNITFITTNLKERRHFAPEVGIHVDENAMPPSFELALQSGFDIPGDVNAITPSTQSDGAINVADNAITPSMGSE